MLPTVSSTKITILNFSLINMTIFNIQAEVSQSV